MNENLIITNNKQNSNNDVGTMLFSVINSEQYEEAVNTLLTSNVDVYIITFNLESILN